MKRVLVIGKNGQMANCLKQVSCSWGQVETMGRPELDLVECDSVLEAVARHSPNLVINTAAYTAVDKAESEPDLAHAINALAAGKIAAAAHTCDAPIIHLSTDYVFDGKGMRPFHESDTTAPLGVYGRTKLEGEQRVAEANPRHIIVRTSWLYSAFGENFVKTMLRLGAERKKLTIVADQIGCPTSGDDLAKILLQLGQRICSHPQEGDFGIVHACGTGIASWYDFAKAIFANTEFVDPVVVPIETRAYPTPAKRPANSRLDMTRLEGHFGLHMPLWNKSLETTVSQLHKG